MMKRRTFLNQALKGLAIAGIPSIVQSCAPTALAASVTGSAQGDQEQIAKLIADKNKPAIWVFSGDSITHGAVHTHGLRSYPEIFTERIRTEIGRGRDFVINTAISGHTSKDIRNDFDWRIKQFNPRVVSLMVGTNDAAVNRNISVSMYEENMNWLIDNFRKIKAIPIIHTPNTIQYKLPGGDVRLRLPEYVDAIYKVARKHDVILVDNWKYWQENNAQSLAEGWYADALHPSGKGHLEIARLMFKTMGIFNEKSFTCTGVVKC